MTIRYVLDDAGRKLVVLTPYDEWEALASLPEHLEPNEETIHAKQAGLLPNVAPVMDRMEVWVSAFPPGLGPKR